MKVLVCGAGVIGVTTAYYLATMGHDVVVVDRLSAPGMDTSFANAGQVSWGYASPWAAPGIPLEALHCKSRCDFLHKGYVLRTVAYLRNVLERSARRLRQTGIARPVMHVVVDRRPSSIRGPS